MLRWFARALLLLLLPLRSTSAQSEADKVRILAWYARLVASSALSPFSIIFVLPKSAPENPTFERQLPVLRLAFEQANVPTTPQEAAPGRDTIHVFLGIPQADSSAGEWTHYTLFESHTDGAPRGETGIFVSRLLCSRKQCFFLSQSPVGSAPLKRVEFPG